VFAADYLNVVFAEFEGCQDGQLASFSVDEEVVDVARRIEFGERSRERVGRHPGRKPQTNHWRKNQAAS
jgi:hypothetical protein